MKPKPSGATSAPTIMPSTPCPLKCSSALAPDLWGALVGRSPTPPPGYTAEELERDNPYNQWIYEQ